MGYKTILVHYDASQAAAHRLGMPVGLARRFDAHLVGLYPRLQFESPMLFNGDFAMGRYYAVFRPAAATTAALPMASLCENSQTARTFASLLRCGISTTAAATLTAKAISPKTPINSASG